jgi:hypothetical protein
MRDAWCISNVSGLPRMMARVALRGGVAGHRDAAEVLRGRAKLVHVAPRLQGVVLCGRHQAERHRECLQPADALADGLRGGAVAGARAPEAKMLPLTDRAVADHGPRGAGADREGGAVNDPGRGVAAARVEPDVAQLADAERLRDLRQGCALPAIGDQPVDVAHGQPGVRHGARDCLARQIELGARRAAGLGIRGLADSSDRRRVSEHPGHNALTGCNVVEWR